MLDFVPSFIIYTFYFLLGTAVGSFLNVWSNRLLLGKSPTGRSRCEHCGRVLGFFDLIPLLSFVLLGGRCRYCDQRLSWQYPLVEGATGLLFVALSTKFPISNFQFPDIITYLLLLITSSSLIVIFITDFQKQVIFDQVLWVALGAAVLYRLVIHLSTNGYSAQGGSSDLLIASWLLANDLIAAFGIYAFFWAIKALTRGRGMGEGDSPLAFVAALLVGFPGALVELFLAFVVGGAVGAVLVLSGKNKLKDRIAFGPFLVAAVFATLFFGDWIWSWYLGLLGL